ncbi:uncharacterized protein LOC136089687 [Hydra vulgaris]|uniref:Uncharacterized protein LOC136089687 n=1 Tax=Hydra vulgaris TaxID=6087 RepID=A0ABM4DBQ8_HYDVU
MVWNRIRFKSAIDLQIESNIKLNLHFKNIYVLIILRFAQNAYWNRDSIRLKKWKKELCNEHQQNIRREECQLCEKPFLLYKFPSENQKNKERQLWVKALRREFINKTLWQPTGSDRVCSIHFVDRIPSTANPTPTLCLGYEIKANKSRRNLLKHPIPLKKQKLNCTAGTSCSTFMTHALTTSPHLLQPTDSNNISTFMTHASGQPYHSNDISTDLDEENNSPQTNILFFSPVSDHSYCSIQSTKVCKVCVDKSNLIESLISKVNTLTLTCQRFKRQIFFDSVKSPVFTWRKIKTDAKMNFYTGLSTITLFESLFLLIKPYLPNLFYWSGPKRFTNSKNKKKHALMKKSKKLSQRDEFLLVLMRLRLGLLNQDLADRFGISPALCSRTFTTWIKMLSQVLGKALVVWLPRESIRSNLPPVLVKAGYQKCRVILDCAEVFIERSKSLDKQSSTWSDYKHHNTFKFLIGVSPTGYITFLSSCYGGRASDRFITRDSGIYNLLERGDEVMAD